MNESNSTTGRYWPMLTDEIPVDNATDQSIGDFIKRTRKLSDEEIARILAYQKDKGVRFGEAAVALKMVSAEDVLWALSQQFHYPYASGDGSTISPELVVAADPFSNQAEVFRDLRSQLIMGALNPEESRRALAVVSPNAGDGKTFFAANLAVVLSQLGARTLLIDADMRTPRQHELFRVDNKVGLSSILLGRASPSVVQPVADLSTLFLIPVGTTPPNPLELVQSPAFNHLIQEVLLKFDYVVVDTPAMVHGADARVIAAKCGAAIAMGRQGTTTMKAMKTLMSGLAKSPVKVAGVLMNEY
jgi:protein-tyrosine kinase